MNRTDRALNAALLALAATAWAALAYVFVTLDPTRSAAALLAGGLLLCAAIALTLAPLLWLGSFVRANRIAYRGAWWRAARRAALVGLVVFLLVLMRGQGVFSLPLALFVIAMAVLVELTLSFQK